MRCKTCSATRTVRKNLMSFINISFLVHLIQNMPNRFDIIIIQCDIGIIQVNKICHPLCHISPKTFILKHRLSTLFVECFDSIRFNLCFVVQAKSFFYFDFYRQSMCIPTCFSLYLIALHGFVSTYIVLQCSCNNVVNSGFSVCCRRSFKKHKLLSVFSL